jgi:hypothetical protein
MLDGFDGYFEMDFECCVLMSWNCSVIGLEYR